MQLGMTPRQQQEYLERNQPRVQAKVIEPVLAWSLFYRTGSMGAMAASYMSPLAASAIRFVGKKRAPGLPERFVLVLTATTIRAFSFKSKRAGLDVRDELAVWDRATIRVSVQETAVTMRLTIASPCDGETVVCDTGKADVTDDFLRALGVPAQQAA